MQQTTVREKKSVISQTEKQKLTKSTKEKANKTFKKKERQNNDLFPRIEQKTKDKLIIKEIQKSV